jgi:hypothetical protein
MVWPKAHLGTLHMQGRTNQTEVEAWAIVVFLDGLPLERTKVSLKEVKKAVGSKLSSSGFRIARDLALVNRPQWRLDGRSLVRIV